MDKQSNRLANSLAKLSAAVVLLSALPAAATADQSDDYSFIADYIGKSTNELMWDDLNPNRGRCTFTVGDKESCLNTSRFVNAVRRFFGTHKDTYLGRRQLTADSMLAVLGGAPEEVTQADDEFITAAACRAHSCTEHGLLIYSPENNCLAFAMLHYFVVDAKTGQKRHLQTGYVTLFVKLESPQDCSHNDVIIAKQWQAHLVDEYAGSRYFQIQPQFRVETIP